MPPIAGRLPTCRTHTRVAGWTCDSCAQKLCADCVETATHGWTTLERCRACGGNARRITIHRSYIPYGTRVLGAWRYPLAPTGIVSTAIFAALHLAGEVIPPLGFIDVVFWGYVFWLVRESARGHDEIGPPDFTDLTHDVFAPTLRALVASAWVVLPVVAWLLVREPGGGFDPLVPVFLIAGLLYVPMAFLIAATGTGILDLLNPVAGVGYATRLGRDYWICVAALAVVAVAAAIVSLVGALTPLVGIVIRAFAWVYFPFVGARVLGLLLYTRGDSVGYGVASDYLVPLVEAVPSAAPALAIAAGDAASGPPQPSRAAQPPAATAPPTSVAAAPPSPVAPAGRWAAPLKALSSALEARDADAVLASFEGLPEGAAAAVAPEAMIQVAQAAATRERFDLARLALEGATRTGSPHEARAWVLLARLHAEKLGDPRRANEIYRFVCRRFPGSPAAKFAEERLTSI